MSWFDENQPPTNSAPIAGSAPMTLGSLGQTTNTAPTAGAMPMGGSTSTASAPGTLPWIQQQLAAVNSTDDPNYWAKVIAADPKVAAGDQSAIQYWQHRIATGDGVNGGAGAGGGGVQGVSSTNPNGIPGLDPGYQFQVGQAMNAIQRSAASKGTLLTGGTLKGLADFIGNDMASSAYQGAFGRSLSLAQLGENAAAGQGQNNSGYATNATNAITGNANAQGAAGIAQGNIIGNAINNAATGYTLNNLFKPANSFTPDPSYNYEGGG